MYEHCPLNAVLADCVSLSLPPATKLGQGYVFTRVCNSVHGGCLPQCMLGYTSPPGADTLPPGADTPPLHPPGPVHAGRYG